MSDDIPELNMIDERSQESRIQDFSDLLSKITNVDDKRKQLWKEIYENAILDRRNAYVMFIKLNQISKDNSNEHAVHGRTMATYLERMSRSNDQLIKLSEILSHTDEDNKPIDSDKMFEMIRKK
jgi:hypothetical protein